MLEPQVHISMKITTNSNHTKLICHWLMTVLYFVCPDDVSSQTDKEERDPEFDVMSMPVYLQLYDMLLKVDIR